ncbi:sugar ABC transporter substrate-binding protein [Ruania alkalisoli]|uniref:Sugar ABC transporter substrate-binding protein n=1 Tax=Ruania alkalisoli TaxID=2779775 RepID=A0A7M1SXY0_9MICO|nr:sugar ABC transporter substrate-binding protein [Ruania alkalisoli]QOR71834.1 sugar ABC transporter substrate-binding protein [Ruania alkalisoli]
MSRTASRRHISAALCLAGTAALSLAACTTGTADPAPDPESPVVLEYWSWAPNIEEVVSIWNEANPDIQVEVNNSAGGGEITAKLLAAAEGGNLPDLSNITYDNLPTLVVNEIADDVSDAMGDREADTAVPAWNLTTFGGVNYAVPQGTSPQMLFYRTDVFAELGLEPPTTWDEYAQAARVIRENDPDTYLATFPSNDASLFAALAQQAGGQWWSNDGEQWSVDIDGDASVRVADYWQGLVDEGVVATMNTYTPEWQAAVADGTLVSWLGAVWSPPLIEQNAPDTAGLWRAVEIPQWDPEPAAGVMGGSGTVVTTQTEHPEQAREFALWLNTSPEAIEAYIEHASIWPSALEGREIDALQSPPDFMSEQSDYYELAARIDEYTVPVTWGPNVAFGFDSFSNAVSEALSTGTSFADALTVVQQSVVEEMASLGYPVE